uniref:Uncharacterized protein n=1 Tax=Amphimedon queenslandica TaxID=400682 RepID=A0A1X7THX0_AMPQE
MSPKSTCLLFVSNSGKALSVKREAEVEKARRMNKIKRQHGTFFESLFLGLFCSLSCNLHVSIVSFSNGRLDSSSAVKAKHSLYQEKGMKRRTLVTKMDHMTYIGTNYETEGTMSTFSFRKYMIGVLDKETGTMELHNTDIFHMTPYIKVTDPNPSKRKSISKEEYSEGLEKVMMSFGSSQAKKAWSAAKRNHID